MNRGIFFFPFCDGPGTDPLLFAGEVHGQAEPGIGFTVVDKGGEQLVVAVGGFNEELRAGVSLRFVFQFPDCTGPGGIVDG